MTLLASIGNTKDAEKALNFGATRPEILKALAVSARERKLKPPPGATDKLDAVFASGSDEAKVEAIHLCAAWKLENHGDAIEKLAESSDTEGPVRAAAIEALSVIGGPGALTTLENLSAKIESPSLRNTALASLAQRDLKRATSTAVGILERGETHEIGSMIGGILSRQKGADTFAVALENSKITADQAKLIRRWMNTVGRSDTILIAALDKKIGVVSPIPTYSPELVAKLAKDALENGNAKNGKAVFQMPLVTCTSCHAVDGIKGVANAMKGPNLSAVAAGLPIELLIESVLWPGRQIKEGYGATTILTKDGGMVSGFAHSRNAKRVGVRNLATGKIVTVPVPEIKSETTGGTMMPPGLTSSLTDQELRDLIKFLSTLKTGAAQ